MIGLYINWDFDSEIVNIFGFPLKYYGLLFGGGLLLCTYILKGVFKRENLSLILDIRACVSLIEDLKLCLRAAHSGPAFSTNLLE